MKTLIYFLSIDNMKTLIQHIEEKLKVNKNYKSGELDWSSAVKFISFRFARNIHNDLHIFVRNVRNVTSIGEIGDDAEYIVDSYSSLLGNEKTRYELDEKSNVLYVQSDWCLDVLIHPEDIERIKDLYNSIDYLDEGTKYSKYDILNQLHIDSSFVRYAHDNVFEFVNFKDSREQIKKELEQLLK